MRSTATERWSRLCSRLLWGRSRRLWTGSRSPLKVPPKVIAARLGHADTQVLFEHYVKEFEEQDRQAGEALHEALRAARGTRMGHAEGDG